MYDRMSLKNIKHLQLTNSALNASVLEERLNFYINIPLNTSGSLLHSSIQNRNGEERLDFWIDNFLCSRESKEGIWYQFEVFFLSLVSGPLVVLEE